jgi:hypothetical protein
MSAFVDTRLAAPDGLGVTQAESQEHEHRPALIAVDRQDGAPGRAP